MKYICRTVLAAAVALLIGLTPARAQDTKPNILVVWAPGGVSLWIILPLVVAFGGWGLAYYLHIKSRPSFLAQAEWGKTLYVLFLNKLYFDEIYEVYVVQPTLRFSKWLWKTVDVGGIDHFITGIAGVTVQIARWLWQVVDSRGIDRAVVGFARQTVSLARWLWHVVDVRGIDRSVVGIGRQTVNLAQWLWQFIDIRGIEKNVERLGREVDATGHMLQRIEPRTLQHHLLVMIFWLVAAIGLFYWLV